MYVGIVEVGENLRTSEAIGKGIFPLSNYFWVLSYPNVKLALTPGWVGVGPIVLSFQAIA